MDDVRLRESQALLERIQDRDRDRARQRMQTAPDELTEYERGLLGDDYRAFVRQREAAQQAARERAERTMRQRAAVTVALCPSGIVFRNDFLRRLNAHAIDLAVRYGLTVIRSNDCGGWASAETRTISAPAATSEENYAVVLHEIGHAVDPDADSRQYAHFIEDGHLHAADGELGAWAWAAGHALMWTLGMQARLEESLQHHPAFRRATPDTRAAITDLCARCRAKVSGSGALPGWRQRSYDVGARVVHKGFAWKARVHMDADVGAWPAPGDEPVCWAKDPGDRPSEGPVT